jgi:hypothetical protein
MYRTLKAANIVSTLETLRLRVGERFPNSGLAKVCADLVGVAQTTAARVDDVERPHWGMRFALATVVMLALLILLWLASHALTLKGTDEFADVMQAVDAAVNLAVILGGAAFFVSTFENRWKRGRALEALHELRSIVHVIDMHQLTKDPSMLGGARTSASPDRDLSPFELIRYLDYCSEMLSLTAKLAALYAERLSDAVVVDTVGDIERLTSELSSKIWQKISIVQTLEGRERPLPIPLPSTSSSTT